MKYEQITNKEADKIIENRLPLGKFWLIENDKFTAIDNSTGDAWTESFDTISQCESYLDEE